MNTTEVSMAHSTMALCGEHGAPIMTSSDGRDLSCVHGCDLAWGDLQSEIGEVIEAHAGYVYVVDLTETHDRAQRLAHSDTNYRLAYGEDIKHDGIEYAPSYVLHHFSTAMATAWEQGWGHGVQDGIDDDAALDA